MRLDDIRGSEDFRRLNAGVLGGGLKTASRASAPPVRATSKPMSEDGAVKAGSKTEVLFRETFLAELVSYWHSHGREVRVVPQPTRFFRLTGGGTYTPDFLVFVGGEKVGVFEVKGGYKGAGWEQGIDRYKRAALEYDGEIFAFTLCTYIRREHRWEFREWKNRPCLGFKVADSIHLDGNRGTL